MFVLDRVSFVECSAKYGGAIYLVISGDPCVMEMSGVMFEGNGNVGYSAGNTLYIVWKSISNIYIAQLSSFIRERSEEEEEGGGGGNGEEVRIETWKGKIVGLEEFVSGRWMNGFEVRTEIDVSDSIGKVVVEVMEEEEEKGEEEEEGEEEGEEGEEGSGEGCVVGMEGGEVNAEVYMGKKVGEVNGEGVVVDVGKELKRVLEECEEIKIVMNVTYGG